jgi:hypothetical protein
MKQDRSFMCRRLFFFVLSKNGTIHKNLTQVFFETTDNMGYSHGRGRLAERVGVGDCCTISRP